MEECLSTHIVSRAVKHRICKLENKYFYNRSSLVNIHRGCTLDRLWCASPMYVVRNARGCTFKKMAGAASQYTL